MRIRTIKPEFWSHPVLSKLTDEVRLTAVGLLNLADDEGYFQADPALVRSSLFPFDDDSTKARRIIAALSRIGYIEVREHAEQGPLGYVVNFRKHQRIDRPRDSTLKTYFNSTNHRRTFDDDSLLEWKGMEGKGTGKGRAAPPLVLKTEILPEQIYDAYPRKVAKGDAVKAIQKAMTRIDPETLLRATQEYAEATANWKEADKQFIPYPASWYNQERYYDDRSLWYKNGFVPEKKPEVKAIPEPNGWRELLKDSVYGPGQDRETQEWAKLPREVQEHAVRQLATSPA